MHYFCRSCEQHQHDSSKLCIDCECMVAALVNPALAILKSRPIDAFRSVHFRRREGTVLITAKNNVDNAIRVRNEFCRILGCKFGEKVVISNNIDNHDYILQITRLNYWGKEFVPTASFYDLPKITVDYQTRIFVSIKKIHQPKSLTQIAIPICAQLGRTDGLTDDTIDQLIEYDCMLAIRFLY